MTAHTASRWLWALLGGLLFAAMPWGAQAGSELKVLATDPAPDALLARQQPFFVRFEVTSAAPIAVSVSGWFKGSPVLDNGGTGTPARLAEGGIGVVSFFYWGEQPTRIDEVRLHLTDARGANITEYGFPVALTWLGDDAPPREPAAWVREWKQASATGARDPAAPQHGTLRWLALAAVGLAVAALAASRWWRWRRRRARVPVDDADRRA